MAPRQVKSAGKKTARRTAPRKKAAKGASKRTLALRSGRERDEVKSLPVKKGASRRTAPRNRDRKREAGTSEGYGFSGGDAFPSLVASQIRFMETMLRWSPLGFLMRINERSEERPRKPKGR